MLKRVLILLVIVVGLLPGVALAQGPNGNGKEEPRDILVRIDGPVNIPAGQTAQSVVVISDNAVVDGTVDYLVVIGGDATIAGTVNHTVTMINGTVTLKNGAHIGNDVLLYRADAVQEPGATVAGGIHKEWGGVTFGLGFFWFGLWVSMTAAILIAGLIFAAVGGRQLLGAAEAVTHRVGQTLTAALVVFIGVPILMVLVMATLIGIPLGIGILLFLLPALWFIGYLVAGAAAGSAIVRARVRATDTVHPYLAVTLGLFIFQVVALVPFVGGVAVFFAGVVGAGALVYRAWLGFRGTLAGRPAPTPPAPAAPAP